VALTPGSNPGLCGERPATNRLSHGTAYYVELVYEYSLIFLISSINPSILMVISTKLIIEKFNFTDPNLRKTRRQGRGN
jgi:hypothetical protein